MRRVSGRRVLRTSPRVEGTQRGAKSCIGSNNMSQPKATSQLQHQDQGFLAMRSATCQVAKVVSVILALALHKRRSL